MIRTGGSQITCYYVWIKSIWNILSIRVLEWLVILVGFKIKGINELEAIESKNLFVWLCSL